MKYYRMSYEEVVFNRSYINILLLNRAIPSFKIDKDDEEDFDTPFGKMKRNKKKRSRPSATNASEFFMQFM